MSSAPSRPPSSPARRPEAPDPQTTDGSGQESGQGGPDGGPSRRPLNTALLALFAAGASMFMTSGPLWMTVAGLVAGVAGIFFAVVALVRLRVAERRAVIVFSALVAMAVAGFGLVTGGVRLAFWDTVSTYERCMTDSVTISGQAGCQQKMEDNLQGILLPGLE